MQDATERRMTPAGQRILDVASDLFYQHGIRAVGVDLIAKEAGVTKKTIYDRFGSKDALVDAYLEGRDRAWRELIAERVERPEFGPRDRILAMFDIMDVQLRSRGCSFINAHAELSEPEHPAYRRALNEKKWTRECFTSLAREAGAADPEKLGSQLTLLHEGAYVAYAMANDVDAARRARDAAEILLDAAMAETQPDHRDR
jgi:AcrR family transcriptional regulator